MVGNGSVTGQLRRLAARAGAESIGARRITCCRWGERSATKMVDAYVSAISFSRARASNHILSKVSFAFDSMSISTLSSVPPFLSTKV